jgi:hypothetical protein
MIVDEINLTGRLKMGTAKKIEFKMGDTVVFRNKWGYTTSGPIIEFFDMPTIKGDVPAITVEAEMLEGLSPSSCMLSIKGAIKEINRLAKMMDCDAYTLYNGWQAQKLRGSK